MFQEKKRHVHPKNPWERVLTVDEYVSSWVVSATVVPPRTPIFIGFAWTKVGIGVTSRAAHRCATPMLGWFLFVFHSDYSQTNTPWKRLKRKNECVALDDVPFHYAVMLSFQLLVLLECCCFYSISFSMLYDQSIFNEAQHLRKDVSSVFKQSVLGIYGDMPTLQKKSNIHNASVRNRQWCLINVNPVLKCTKALCLRNMDAPSLWYSHVFLFATAPFIMSGKGAIFLMCSKFGQWWGVFTQVSIFVDEICKNGL